jgi:two-component system, HptB-dependent secretion and biofilm response regulator
LVAIRVPTEEEIRKMAPKSGYRNGFLSDWELSLTLVASSLKTFNPLSLLMLVLSEVPGLRQYSSVLYTVMSELFNNALEHGVLGLESSIKSTPAGFAEYYRLRREKLEAITLASIRFELQHEVKEGGGILTITVLDSGAGFVMHNEDDFPVAQEEKRRYYGRGLTLVASICDSVTVIEPGNKVQAKFVWSHDEHSNA